jgi:hypothetical protein
MFDLQDYETIAQRIKRFRTEFISGRIETSIIDVDLTKGHILVEARVYREHEDTSPAAIDYAYGNQAFYNQNMKRWFVEDTTSSAIGRAISLLTPGEHRSTAETMAQVVTDSPAVLDSDPWATVTVTTEQAPQPLQVGLDLIQGALGGTITETGAQCAHGRMVWKEGISSKTGNKYKGWVCPSKEKPQCPPKWEKD